MGSAADYEFMLRVLVRYGVQAVYISEVLVAMQVGGVSNARWQDRLRANRMDRRAWAVNGLRSYPGTLWLKPLRKLNQWWVKGTGRFKIWDLGLRISNFSFLECPMPNAQCTILNAAAGSSSQMTCRSDPSGVESGHDKASIRPDMCVDDARIGGRARPRGR